MEASMDNLVRALEIAARVSRFECPRFGCLNANEFAELVEARKWNSFESFTVERARLQTNDEGMTELVEILDPILAPFRETNSDRIGNGLFWELLRTLDKSG